MIGPKQPSQSLYSRNFSSGPLAVLASSSLLSWQHLRTLSPSKPQVCESLPSFASSSSDFWTSEASTQLLEILWHLEFFITGHCAPCALLPLSANTQATDQIYLHSVTVTLSHIAAVPELSMKTFPWLWFQSVGSILLFSLVPISLSSYLQSQRMAVCHCLKRLTDLSNSLDFPQ